jgi:hypothetical protein
LVLLHLDSALRMIDSPAIYAFRKFDMKESLRKPVVKALGCYQAALRRQHNGSRRGPPAQHRIIAGKNWHASSQGIRLIWMANGMNGCEDSRETTKQAGRKSRNNCLTR